MKFKIKNAYKCPKGHKAKIIWISENKKSIAVKCPQKHYHRTEKNNEIFVKNMVFLIKFDPNSFL